MLDVEGLASKEVNFKSSLLEWSQKNRIKIEFTLNNTEKPGSNSPVFSSTVVLEGVLAGEGKGFSKKESQQLAAKDALTKMRRSQDFVDSIFREKEKRTAMGAEEFSAVPQIEEIEDSINSENAPATEENTGEKKPRRRGRRRTPQRAPEQEKTQQATQAENETEAPAPKKSRSRSSRRRNSPGRNGGESKQNDCSREDIIRAAEEAAFK
jgi:ribonuclease-3